MNLEHAYPKDLRRRIRVFVPLLVVAVAAVSGAAGCGGSPAILNTSLHFVKEDEWKTTIKNTGGAKLRVTHFEIIEGSFEVKDPEGCERTYNPSESCSLFTVNEEPGEEGVLKIEWDQWLNGEWVPATPYAHGLPA